MKIDMKPLFCINLELHDGTNENIEFRQNDVPEDVAAKFCQRKGLKKKIYNLIVIHLNEKLNELSKTTTRQVSIKGTDINDFSTTIDARHEHKATLEYSKKKPTSTSVYDTLNFSPLLKSRDLDIGSNLKSQDMLLADNLAKSRSNIKRSNNLFTTKQSHLNHIDPGMTAPPAATNRGDFQFRTMQIITQDENGYYETPASIDDRWQTNDTVIHASMDAGDKDERLFINPSYKADNKESREFYMPYRPRSTVKHRASSNERGHHLYEMAISQHIRKQRNHECAAKVKEECEMSGITFTPSINAISSMIVDKQHDTKPRYERLHEMASAKKIKLERCRQLKNEIENVKYEYKPQICELSKKLDRENIVSNDKAYIDSRFDLLYDDSKLRQSYKNILKDQNANLNCTFHPEINIKSQKIVRDGGNAFNERLATSIEKIRQNEINHRVRMNTPSVEPKPTLSRSIKSNWVTVFHSERQISRRAPLSIRYGT